MSEIIRSGNTALSRQNQSSVSALYVTAALELMGSMLTARESSPLLSMDEHNQLAEFTVRTRQLAARHARGHRCAIEGTLKHLNEVHQVVRSFASQMQAVKEEIDGHMNGHRDGFFFLPDECLNRWYQKPLRSNVCKSRVHPQVVLQNSISEFCAFGRQKIKQLNASSESIEAKLHDVLEYQPGHASDDQTDSIDTAESTSVALSQQAQSVDPLECLFPRVERTVSGLELNPFVSSFAFMGCDLVVEDVRLSPAIVNNLNDSCSTLWDTCTDFRKNLSLLKRLTNDLECTIRMLSDQSLLTAVIGKANHSYEDQIQTLLNMNTSKWIVTDDRSVKECKESAFVFLPRIVLPDSLFRDSVREDVRISEHIQQLQMNHLPSAVATARSELDSMVSAAKDESRTLVRISELAIRGDIKRAIVHMDSLQRVFDLPYGDTQRDIDTQVKIRESIRDRFALCRREYQVLQNSAKSSAKAKLLTWLGDTVGDDSRLEAALIETTQLVQRVKWAKSSECMKEIRSLIKESELWSLRCEILLRWVPVRPSLSDALKLQESPKWTAEQAFVNAMCAVAAADGDFCVDEKRAVVRIAKRVGIATDDEAVSIVIESVKTWLQVARKEGLTVMLARSVRGIVNIEDQTLRNKLRKALQFIADADGTREQREDAILKLMQPYL